MFRLRGHTTMGSQPGVGTILKFRKGEIIYSQGDTAGDWYTVISGTVRTCYLSCDGHRQLTGFFYDGDVFGIDHRQYSASAEAVTAVVLRRNIRGGDADDRASDTSPVNGALQSALNNAQACIFLLGKRTATARLAAFLLATSSRFPEDKAFALPMSRSDIADHLGLTIHTVSRTLSEFVRRKIISMNGPQAITINDPVAMRHMAQNDGNAVSNFQPAYVQHPAHANGAASAAHREYSL